MKLKRLNQIWNRITRNDMNENFDKIERDFNGVVDVVSNKAYNQVVDAAKLNWLEPVGVFADLRTTYPKALEGDTAMAREVVDGVNKVYRYNGTEWKEIQQISADAVNEVDERLSQQLSNIAIDVKSYGASEENVNNKSIFDAAFRKANTIIIPTGHYRLSQFAGVSNQHVNGMGSTLLLFKDVATVLAVFGNNSTYENIIFECVETDLEWVRASLEDTENVIFKNCTFRGFRNPTKSNAWGIYLKRAKNITLDNCKFSNNTQSDIAILEGSENITIINPSGENGEDMVLNLEPNNGLTPIRSINVIGGRYEKVMLLENSNIAYSISGVVLNGCEIDTLIYDGANASFIECDIKTIVGEDTGNQSFAGVVDFNNSIAIGKNLIPDTRLISVSRDDISHWIIGGSNLPAANYWSRIDDVLIGKALRLNPTGASSYLSVKLKNNINGITSGKKYLFALTSRALYPTGAAYVGSFARINFYSADSSLIKSLRIQTNRAQETGITTKLNTEVAVLTAPNGCVACNIVLGNGENTQTNTFDVVSVSLHEITESNHGAGNTSDIKNLHSLVFDANIGFAPTQPKNGYYYSNYFIGDKIYIPPTIGGYEGYVCIESGVSGSGGSAQGVWKGFGQIVDIKKGVLTYNGDGLVTKTIPHGLSGTPTVYQVTPSSSDAGTAGIKFVTANASNLNVTFNIAPVTGTNNVSLNWKAEV